LLESSFPSLAFLCTLIKEPFAQGGMAARDCGGMGGGGATRPDLARGAAGAALQLAGDRRDSATPAKFRGLGGCISPSSTG
jgi:hypothetical protein